MTWPPRWIGPQFKTGVSSKIEKAKTRESRKQHELREKQRVRQRDKKCRFPGCGCKKLKLQLEVSHCIQHKGMGGNPKGDRSMADQMILVCVARHRLNTVSIDKGTVECRPLTSRGTDGPVAWWVHNGTAWYLLATERAGGGYDQTTGWQYLQMRTLAEMTS